MSKEHIAHVKKHDDGSWAPPQPLADHLKNTADLAAGFSAKFNSAEWGRACGFGHDAGKGRQSWQDYLICKSGYSYEKEVLP